MDTIVMTCSYCKEVSATGLRGLRLAQSWRCASCSALSRLSVSQREEIDARMASAPDIRKRR